MSIIKVYNIIEIRLKYFCTYPAILCLKRLSIGAPGANCPRIIGVSDNIPAAESIESL